MAEFPHAEIAVIPYGTSCDFARAFGENAYHTLRNIDKQVNAKTVHTDIIDIGSKYAISFIAAGIEASAVLKFYEASRRYPNFVGKYGKIIFTIAAFFAIFDERVTNQAYEVTIDGENYDGNYSSINIANSPCYGGNKTAVPMALPTNGYLDIIFSKSISRLRLMSVVLPYTQGKFHKHPDIFKYVRGKEISIRSKSPLQMNTDGESYYDANVDAKIKPSAVKVAVPDGLEYVLRWPQS